MLDSLALVGAIEAVVNAVSLAADDAQLDVDRPPLSGAIRLELGGQSDLSLDWCPPVAPMHTEGDG